MTTMNISLPDSMRAFIDQRVKADGYSTASEYLRTLIREDQKHKADDRLETLLLEGLESGEAEKLTSEDWQEIRNQVHQHLRERPKRAR